MASPNGSVETRVWLSWRVNLWFSTDLIEYLRARKSAPIAARAALEQGNLDLRSVIDCLKGVRYVSRTDLKQLGSKLLAFFDVNNPGNLKRAERMLKRL